MASHMCIGAFAIRRLFAKGKLSLIMIAQAYMDKNPCPRGVAASTYEGEILAGLTEDLEFWFALNPHIYRPPLSWGSNPVLVPAFALTSPQADVLHRWIHDRDGFNMENKDRSILDTILWKFGPGWRSKYKTKSIPHRG